ncbi:protein BASIC PENTACYSTEINE2-like [Malania oleifera]|uniref:protein BASIC PENTACYSTEINE2-like n=1 Tax=Malania oleifera TaxID=397392 RepID=UPI0025AE3B3E|nr:protein BASIC PENTACYSTEINE2-like [Malania oleifera]
MEGNGDLNVRNWGFYEPTASFKGHLGLQLMSPLAEKHLLNGRNAAIMPGANRGFHHRDWGFSHSQAPIPMEHMRDAWINPREKLMGVLPGNHPNFGVAPEVPGSHTMPILQPPSSSKDDQVIQMEEASGEKDNGRSKKRSAGKAPKSPKTKKAKKASAILKDGSSSSAKGTRSVKKNVGVVINGIDMDISGIPVPVCSCTGIPQQCYRWGSGGWQSACCTTGMSVYPLPMSTKRRGARIAGRKMSLGAFKKVLERLSVDGYNFSNPIDLRTHWAKHGTNKFVTIR